MKKGSLKERKGKTMFKKMLNKKVNKKGFTLAELLIVIAILGILVAVSIPVFVGKLDDAKVKTDTANERAAKAAAVTEFLNEDLPAGEKRYYNAETGKLQANKGTAYGQKEEGVIYVQVDAAGKVTLGWE